MSAYLIVEHKVTDPKKFAEYGRQVRPMLAKYGVRRLTDGDKHKVLETSHWQPDRVFIFEFPDMVTLKAWYASEEYRPLIALRQAATDMACDVMIAIDGVQA